MLYRYVQDGRLGIYMFVKTDLAFYNDYKLKLVSLAQSPGKLELLGLIVCVGIYIYTSLYVGTNE